LAAGKPDGGRSSGANFEDWLLRSEDRRFSIRVARWWIKPQRVQRELKDQELRDALGALLFSGDDALKQIFPAQRRRAGAGVAGHFIAG